MFLDFFIIVSGECSVTQTNEKGTGEVAKLSSADYFGEIALLTGDTRKATVTASTEVQTVKLDRERFERVLGPCKEILARDAENYKAYSGE